MNPDLLTKREKEIAHHICMGRTNRMIAEHLYLSVDTVHTHRKNIFRKLEIHNIASLVRLMLQN